MIRREFLKQAAALASGLAAKISYGAAPCPMIIDDAASTDCTQSNLERRTGALTSSNTPQLGVNYFRSEDGDPYQIANNRTNQVTDITWQVQGIYYDPIRRVMHQLDKQHTGGYLEHAVYDETTNTWSQIPAPVGLRDGDGASHWRQASFDPTTGRLFHNKESLNTLHIYDPETGWYQTTAEPSGGLTAGGSGPQGSGYHPNLFGPGEPGCLVANVWRFYAWNLTTETWHTLNTSNMSSSNDLYDADRGEGFYIPGRDELLMTARGNGNPNGPNIVYAISAGAGLETDLSTANSAELRFAPPKQISGGSDNNKCYACIHPRQPDVLLAFDAANSNVYYTDDGATTAWKTASFTHPFASELDAIGHYTVGTLPHHSVVAGADGATNNTRFVFWKPPLV